MDGRPAVIRGIGEIGGIGEINKIREI